MRIESFIGFVWFADIYFAAACFSSGICGGGVACAPAIAPVCAGGCAVGYACGQYGCYSRARARSSKTFRFATVDNKHAQKANANFIADEQFYECCVDRRLPDVCLQKCSYATYTKNALQAMYINYDNCPLQALADISYCAARGQDHTDCCLRNGVANTVAGSKCLIFCDQRPGNVTRLDMSYLPCYDRFDNIKSCFMENGERVSKFPASVAAHPARTFGI